MTGLLDYVTGQKLRTRLWNLGKKKVARRIIRIRLWNLGYWTKLRTRLCNLGKKRVEELLNENYEPDFGIM
uniref:Uncharacterized protein n=1 Tax=Rhizophagus irregularis (strain DAOM 181602 / DAOM 197198 / MUCL 43194) TaxID=747089 RepID=U9T377_RHIID